ncbi:GMC oxidoreductase, partial [Streptomyces sp. NPDC051554]|uniref:GMC oxidoreductase n=1 Tax=Streptomyces sp. NPDC051554 TaxID=3365656 RepID=UPI003790725E
ASLRTWRVTDTPSHGRDLHKSMRFRTLKPPCCTGEDLPRTVDILIVGSGLVGSTFARMIADLVPRTRVLMVEVGPRLTRQPGMHIRNIEGGRERDRAQYRSQGPTAVGGSPAVAQTVPAPGSAPARGTFFSNPQAVREGWADTLPAASMSSNVGGMGSHWGAATPFPRGRERIGFIPAEEWAGCLATGRRLLSVTDEPLVNTAAWRATLRRLSAEFDAELPVDGAVRNMPVACRRRADSSAPYWTGSDVVLGELATSPRATFAIAAETLCRRLLTEDGRVGGAELEHLPSGRTTRIAAKVVVVAADSLRTPQLLWASEIRPPALGRYLNDHTIISAGLVPNHLDEPDNYGEFLSRVSARVRHGVPGGIGWIPYADDAHPVHATFGQFEEPSPGEGGRPVGMISFSYLLPKEIRFHDRVRFLSEASDVYGMPGIAIDYGMTERDEQTLDRAKALIERAAAVLGADSPGPNVSVQRDGRSLHYMGTIRMGEHDDGDSVCDSYSRVWEFENLFVGGNGVIPTPIACNPTLTSVALGVRAAVQVAAVATKY